MKNKKETPDKKAISRKEFIKNTALAAAGFYIVPRHVLGGKGYVAPSDKLYIAAVGCGGEAENDIHHYATAPKKNAVIAFFVMWMIAWLHHDEKNFQKQNFITTGGKCLKKKIKILMQLRLPYPIITMPLLV